MYDPCRFEGDPSCVKSAVGYLFTPWNEIPNCFGQRSFNVVTFLSCWRMAGLQHRAHWWKQHPRRQRHQAWLQTYVAGKCSNFLTFLCSRNDSTYVGELQLRQDDRLWANFLYHTLSGLAAAEIFNMQDEILYCSFSACRDAACNFF